MQVDTAASKHELLKSKTEIRLKKADAIKWLTLEKSSQKADLYGKAPSAVPSPVQQPKPAYPSSFNRRAVDWYAALSSMQQIWRKSVPRACRHAVSASIKCPCTQICLMYMACCSTACMLHIHKLHTHNFCCTDSACTQQHLQKRSNVCCGDIFAHVQK